MVRFVVILVIESFIHKFYDMSEENVDKELVFSSVTMPLHFLHLVARLLAY